MYPYPDPSCTSWATCWQADSVHSEYVVALMMQQVQKGQLNQPWRQWTVTDTTYHHKGMYGYWESDTVLGQSYLRLKTHSDLGNWQYLYQWVDTGWCRLVCYGMNDDLTELTDSLQDLNGDGHADYWIHYYPPAGTYRMDIYEVYLYHPNLQQMVYITDLSNPTFYPEAGLVRGFDYDHPDEVDYYTYRWNAHQLDTVELIEQPYRCADDTAAILRHYWAAGKWLTVVVGAVPRVYLE